MATSRLGQPAAAVTRTGQEHGRNHPARRKERLHVNDGMAVQWYRRSR